MAKPPVIDLHQDISYYYVSGASGLGFPLADFSKDIPGRHGDLPKFRKASVRIVFSSIFCLLTTLSPSVSKQLAKGYGTKAYQRSYSTRAAGSTFLEHMKVYYALEEQNPGSITILRKSADVRKSVAGGWSRAFGSPEGADSPEDTYNPDRVADLGVPNTRPTREFYST